MRVHCIWRENFETTSPHSQVCRWSLCFIHHAHAGIGAVFEQEQDENGKMERKIPACASKALSDSQRKYDNTNKNS